MTSLFYMYILVLLYILYVIGLVVLVSGGVLTFGGFNVYWLAIVLFTSTRTKTHMLMMSRGVTFQISC